MSLERLRARVTPSVDGEATKTAGNSIARHCAAAGLRGRLPRHRRPAQARAGRGATSARVEPAHGQAVAFRASRDRRERSSIAIVSSRSTCSCGHRARLCHCRPRALRGFNVAYGGGPTIKWFGVSDAEPAALRAFVELLSSEGRVVLRMNPWHLHRWSQVRHSGTRRNGGRERCCREFASQGCSALIDPEVSPPPRRSPAMALFPSAQDAAVTDPPTAGGADQECDVRLRCA
jgi:hypothetical protein